MRKYRTCEARTTLFVSSPNVCGRGPESPLYIIGCSSNSMEMLGWRFPEHVLRNLMGYFERIRYLLLSMRGRNTIWGCSRAPEEILTYGSVLYNLKYTMLDSLFFLPFESTERFSLDTWRASLEPYDHHTSRRWELGQKVNRHVDGHRQRHRERRVEWRVEDHAERNVDCVAVNCVPSGDRFGVKELNVSFELVS